MIDVNTVKKSARMSYRLDANIKRAVEMFWPENSATMMQVLLTPDNDSDSIINFTSLSVGAMCVWQECWDLLQDCNRRDAGDKLCFDKQLTYLETVKTQLIEAVGQTDYELAAQNVARMEVLYLTLHIHRLLTFIKNPRLRQLLYQLLLRLQGQSVNTSLAPTCSRVNADLKANFNLQQRNNIDDFLQHFEGFFQPDLIKRLEAPKWLICARGLYLQKCQSVQ
jgi:hypothetical protein